MNFEGYFDSVAKVFVAPVKDVEEVSRLVLFFSSASPRWVPRRRSVSTDSRGSRLSLGKEIRGGVWPCRCAAGLTLVERKRGGERDEGGREKGGRRGVVVVVGRW